MTSRDTTMSSSTTSTSWAGRASIGDVSGAAWSRAPDTGGAIGSDFITRYIVGAAQSFKDAVSQVAGHPKVLILRMRNVPAMDSSGVHALLDVIRRARKSGTAVVLAGVHMQPLVALTDSDAIVEIGSQNLAGSLDLALARAREIMEAPVPSELVT